MSADEASLPDGVTKTDDGRYVNENGRYVDPNTGQPLQWNPLMGGNGMLNTVMGLNSTEGWDKIYQSGTAAGFDVPETNPNHDPKYFVGDDGQFYNADGERVYYWSPSGEGASAEQSDRKAELRLQDAMNGNGSYGGNYYTLDQIKAGWDNDMSQFRAAHPDMTWETYQAFITERQGLIESGEMGDGILPLEDISNAYVDASSDPAAGYQGDADFAMGQYTPMDELENEAYLGLMDKYGIQTGYQGSDGSVYQWNGSNYIKTWEPKKENEFAQFMDMGIAAAIGAVGGQALAPLVGGALGSSSGAMGGKLGAGISAGLGNAATQGLLTGSVDPKSVLASAVVGGLNPGGMLGDKLGLVPDNVTAGFVQGATNSAVGDLISTGDLDLKDALIAGGIGAGTNAVKDLFSDTGQFSVESEMRRIELEREMQGLPPLSIEDLRAEAMFGNMTGKSDLGGLIGDDGLLPFIPAVSTGGLNNLLGGGYFDPNAVFTGPDGKEYTDLEVIAQGQNPSDIFTGGVDGWSYSASSGYWSPVKGDGGFDNGFLDALGEQEFKNQYGMTPTDFLAGGGTVDQLKQMIVYGPLDETYNWSDNPRGNSQYVGLLTGLVDGYSTGSLNDQREYQAGDGGIQDALNISNYQDVAANAPDPNGGSVAIINLGGGETVVDPNATLPGSNITVIDAITQGIIDGILVDNSGSATGGNTAGNTADVIGNENAVSTDDVLAGADTNTNTNANINTNENAVSTDDTLAGADTSTNNNEDAISTDDNLADNENAVSTDDVLPSGGNDGGGADDGLFNPPSGDGLPPLWSELYGYSKISSYKGARLKILNDIVSGLNGQGMMTPRIVNEPYMKLNRDLLDAGILS